MTQQPLSTSSRRETFRSTSKTGDGVELSVHSLTPEDIGVDIQNHENFSTLAIDFGNVTVSCVIKGDHQATTVDGQLCIANLEVIDKLINKLVDVELDLRLKLKKLERDKSRKQWQLEAPELVSIESPQ